MSEEVDTSVDAAAAGARLLRADGFATVVPVVAGDGHYDSQGHLNNAAIGQLFNDMRIDYVRRTVGAWWVETMRATSLVVAVRESHILYESQGMPGESFVGAMRYLRIEGKAAVLEQRLVESSVGRPVAQAWVVQLLLRRGTVVDWPAEYFDRVGVIEGRIIERRKRSPRTFGPGT